MTTPNSFSERFKNLSPQKRETLIKLLRQNQQPSDASLTIPPRPIKSPAPLSFAQQRLWFLHQLAPDSPTYNISATLRLEGTLNIAAFEQSLKTLIQRHETLRTTFDWLDGQPAQIITSSSEIDFRLIDLKSDSETAGDVEAQRLVAEAIKQPFNLTTGPLLRVTLFRLNATTHILLFSMHHIISDGWSMGVLVREVTALYKAFCQNQPSPLPDLPIQYADFATWQNRWLQGEVLERQLTYWQQRLGGNLPVLQLPIDRSRTCQHNRPGASQSFRLSPSLSQSLKALSTQANVTLFMTLLAAFQILLYRHTHQEDILVGTDVANRNRAETEPLIGFFVNLLVLRTDLSGNPRFRELLDQVREVTLGAYAHQDLPFAKLVEVLQPDRKSNPTPLFQVLFVLQNAPMPALQLQGVTATPIDINNGTAKFDLALFISDKGEGIKVTWRYDRELFEAATIARLSNHYTMLLNSIVAQPDARIDSLEMRTVEERKQQLTQQAQLKKNQRLKLTKLKPKTIKKTQ